MEELYMNVFRSCVSFAVFGKKEILKDVLGFWEGFKAFAEYFCEENVFSIDEEDYSNLKTVLLGIIDDIVNGINDKDTILLEDTVEFGLLPFLEMFFSNEEIMNMKEATKNESADLQG